jgi:hypothetical protein
VEEDKVLEPEVVEQEEELLEEDVHQNEPEDEQVYQNEQTEEEENPEVVEKAKKYGHISKEDWVAQGRDPAKYKTPEEFNKTGEVIEQFYSLKKKVEQRDREIQALIEYQQRTSQREYEKAKQELEARITASKNDYDMEGIAHYTKELTRLEENERNSQYQQNQQRQQEAQQRFIERNQHWFNDRNADLKQRAIQIDLEVKDKYPNASYDDLAEMIELKMLKEFPERIMGQTKNVRPSVQTSSVNKTAVNTSSTRKVFQGLSQELKDTYNAHKRMRASMGQDLTEAEFIERLKADGEI